MSVLMPHRYAQRIADLLALGLTHEKIALRLAMSPANVGKIARQLGDETPPAPTDHPATTPATCDAAAAAAAWCISGHAWRAGRRVTRSRQWAVNYRENTFAPLSPDPSLLLLRYPLSTTDYRLPTFLPRRLPMPIQDRITELRRVRAKELKPHPLNWRLHPPAQAQRAGGDADGDRICRSAARARAGGWLAGTDRRTPPRGDDSRRSRARTRRRSQRRRSAHAAGRVRSAGCPRAAGRNSPARFARHPRAAGTRRSLPLLDTLREKIR